MREKLLEIAKRLREPVPVDDRNVTTISAETCWHIADIIEEELEADDDGPGPTQLP